LAEMFGESASGDMKNMDMRLEEPETKNASEAPGDRKPWRRPELAVLDVRETQASSFFATDGFFDYNAS